MTDFEEPVLAEHGLQLSPPSSHLRKNPRERKRQAVCSLERERERVSKKHGGGVGGGGGRGKDEVATGQDIRFGWTLETAE